MIGTSANSASTMARLAPSFRDHSTWILRAGQQAADLLQRQPLVERDLIEHTEVPRASVLDVSRGLRSVL